MVPVVPVVPGVSGVVETIESPGVVEERNPPDDVFTSGLVSAQPAKRKTSAAEAKAKTTRKWGSDIILKHRQRWLTALEQNAADFKDSLKRNCTLLRPPSYAQTMPQIHVQPIHVHSAMQIPSLPHDAQPHLSQNSCDSVCQLACGFPQHRRSKTTSWEEGSTSSTMLHPVCRLIVSLSASGSFQ